MASEGEDDKRGSLDNLLSPRQIECLRLAAAGKTSIEIGIILGISHRTVDAYFEDCFRRLGVRGRTQAVARAKELGLI